MSIEDIKNNVWDSYFKQPVVIFLKIAIFILISGLATCLFYYFFHNPVREFVSTFQWYVSGDSVSSMTALEKKELAHLMSKNYILSTNDLVSQVGSFFAYTITILVFFCTISAFFAVLVIKINADDKIDSTINSKVGYFFANNKGFDADLKNKVSGVVAEEIERFSDSNTSEEVSQLRRDVDTLKELLDTLTKNHSLKESEENVDTNSYFVNMLQSQKASVEGHDKESEEADNGNP